MHLSGHSTLKSQDFRSLLAGSGWSMKAEMKAQPIGNALVMAIWRRGKPDAARWERSRRTNPLRGRCAAAAVR